MIEKLPFKFQGIWINTDYGGFHPPLIERFKPEMPRDALYESLKEHSPELAEEPHQHASPRWISKDEFEREYGKVEAVYVAPRFPKIRNKINWNDHLLEQILIWTDKYVVTLEESEGIEYFIALPRNPPKEG